MGMSYRAIGQLLGHHHTTVGREMRRNTNGHKYAPLVAQAQAQKRRECVSGNAKVLTPELKALVIKLLK